MSKEVHEIEVIDSHTEGEPTRVILSGFPALGEGTMSQRLAILRDEYDHWRNAVILEPRGHNVLVGALLCQPVHERSSAGVIFFNNEGYLGMCGHGMIGLIASLYYAGQLNVGEHWVETPVGDVHCTLYENGGVSVKNVYSYRYRKDVEINVPGLGQLCGDIAWGGNWFFLVNQFGVDIDMRNIKSLMEMSIAIKAALIEQNITGKNGQAIDHIELFQHYSASSCRNFVLCPGNEYDRSPCGTGTSAKLACLAEDGVLDEGETWIQTSITCSHFRASYQRADASGIIPTIFGRAYICAESTLLLSQNDPFRWGIAQLTFA